MPGPQDRRRPQGKKPQALRLSLPSTGATGSGGSSNDRPAISALYMVTFDVRTGYTISWQRRAGAGVAELGDSVEFKSLPSGLHNVEEDLVYFVHAHRYAGVSAFASKAGAAHERGALMLAVGVLVRLDNGRLGRCWRHADRLKELARQLVADQSKTALLEAYWELYRADKEEEKEGEEEEEEEEEDGEEGYDKEEGAETKVSKDTEETPSSRPSLEQAQAKSMLAGPAQELSPFHPARSIPTMLETFGPLVYPLYKAALLRKRILILLEAPVELACNFVYDISILSNIPSSLAPLIALEPLPIRLLPLFSVGVHDIDALSTQGRPSISSTKSDADANNVTQSSEGWVACTTDDVLRLKKDLYDVIITLPAKSKGSETKQWPSIQNADGTDIRANNRDIRRYGNLRKQLVRRLSSRTPIAMRYSDDSEGDTSDDDDDGDDEEEPLLGANRGSDEDEPTPELPATQLEPVAWSALAYSSFVWWASAGEKGLELEEEAAFDNSLWTSVESSNRQYTETASLRSAHFGGPLMTDGTTAPSAPEMSIIAYFHRLTTGIMEVLANLVDDAEDDEEREARERRNKNKSSSTSSTRRRTTAVVGEEEEEEDNNDNNDEKEPPTVIVDGEDMVRMGLDPWSEGDRLFTAQLLELYWGRKADVRGGRVECCGMHIC